MSTLVVPYAFEAPAYQSIRYYRFFNEEGTEYHVQFVKDKQSVFNVFVDLSLKNTDDEYATTNNGNVFRIMSTVVHILNHYISRNPTISRISLTAIEEENIDSNRRLLLFERFCKHFKSLNNWNYQVVGSVIELSR